MFYESPGSGAPTPESSELADFLREEALPIARKAAALITGGLPIFGTGARRRLRSRLNDQVLELARHLQSFGGEGPRLYGESQRRYAASQLSEGIQLPEALEERAVVHECILNRWAEQKGDVPAAYARLLALSFAEVTSQAAEVWLTYQRSEGIAFQEAALFDTIVHHLDEAIIVLEPDGGISYATPAIEDILGLPPRYFIGVQRERLGGLLARIDPRDRQGNPILVDQLPHSKALETGETQHIDFARLRRMDGTEAVCELYATPVFEEEEGQLRGVVMTIRDRTQSFQQTEALMTAYDELRLMHARLLSRSRLEAIGELAGSAAHALNNQLNVITLRVRRLLERPEVMEDAAAIERSVREIAALVARLQEFAAAPQPHRPTPVDLVALTRSALEMTKAELGPAGKVHLETRLEAVEPALAEHDTLLEFLTALLLGARDSSPQGATVTVETLQEGHHVVLRVIDRGATLQTHEVEALFEPLASGASPRALLLSVGRQAVLRWGGEVQVREQPGGGNAVEVRLLAQGAAAVSHAEATATAAAEAQEKEQEAEERARASAPAPDQLRRVLVVDDDEDNAAMLADLIRESGPRVSAVTAGTGAEALRLADQLLPQAALVDLLLPDTKGWEVVAELKRRWPSIRVAVVSGLAVGRDEEGQHEADAIFRKPIDSDELLRFLGL